MGWAGFLTFTLCVCPFAKYLKKKKKNIEPINVIFGGSLPSEVWPREEFKQSTLKNYSPGLRVDVGGVRV